MENIALSFQLRNRSSIINDTTKPQTYKKFKKMI
jgi:hypothetical protein